MEAAAPQQHRELPASAIRSELAADLSRRDFIRAGGGLGLAALIAGALPTLERLASPPPAAAQSELLGPTLQAYFDTILPGRKVARTVSGEPVAEGAILGVDPEPGAVEADALLLAGDPRIGFVTIAPAFVAELEARSLPGGGPFLTLPYEGREAVCVAGLSFRNPTRALWEAGAAVAFTAFCAAATMVEPTAGTAPGLRVMGHPGTAPRGYRNASYGRPLARSRTRGGSLR